MRSLSCFFFQNKNTNRFIRYNNEVCMRSRFLFSLLIFKLHFRIDRKSDLLLFYEQTEIIFLFFFDVYTRV